KCPKRPGNCTQFNLRTTLRRRPIHLHFQNEDYKHNPIPAKVPNNIPDIQSLQSPDRLYDDATPVLLYHTTGVPMLEELTPSSTLQTTLHPPDEPSRLPITPYDSRPGP